MDRAVLIVDNGASNIKAGYATDSTCRQVPNYGIRPKREKKIYIADQVENIVDFSGVKYNRPFNRGYIVDLDFETKILSRLFTPALFDCRPSSTTLMLTEPIFNHSRIQDQLDEIVFEKFGFDSLYRNTSPSLALYGASIQDPSFGKVAATIVDMGYSFTHIVPIFRNVPLNHAIRRIDVGGKLLVNYFKECISYRKWNMMDEFHLVENMMKAVCFTSLNFCEELKEMQQNAKDHTVQFILPNGSTHIHGKLRGDGEIVAETDQTIDLCNERICVPEVLFHPSDIGLYQAGVPETIVQAISETPVELHALLYSNILVVGGNAMFPNMRERIEKEVRCLAPKQYQVNVILPDDPITATWQGAKKFALSPSFRDYCVTKKEYEEYGPSICHEKFMYD